VGGDYPPALFLSGAGKAVRTLTLEEE